MISTQTPGDAVLITSSRPLKAATVLKRIISHSTMLLVLLLNWASHSNASTSTVSIKLSSPNWKMSFQPLLNGSGAPKLVLAEYPIVDKLRVTLDMANYSKAMQQLQQQWPTQGSAALLYIRAQIATQLKQYTKAESDYQQSIKLHGDYILAWQGIAGLALSQNHFDKAQRALAKTIALGGASAPLFGQLGYLNLRFHSAFSAISAYQRAYAMEPENPHWQQGLLMALTRSGAYQQADSLINELLEKQANEPELWLHKANAAMAAGNKARAIGALEMATRLGNTQRQNLQLLAQLHLQTGNIQRAITIIRQHRALISDYEFIQPMLTWLSLHQRWQPLEQLIQSSDKQQQKYRSNQRSDLFTHKAKLARHKKQPGDSRRLLKQALKLDPANGEALLLLADEYHQQQQLSRADLLLSRASALSQFKERALLKRAQLDYQRQRYRSAHNYLKQVFRDNPTRRDLIENMDILQRLIRQKSQKT